MERTGRSRTATATLCLVFLLLFWAPREATPLVEETRTCESQSHQFRGRCLSDHNCGLVCRNEGFSNGWCRGFRGRCFCTKPC